MQFVWQLGTEHSVKSFSEMLGLFAQGFSHLFYLTSALSRRRTTFLIARLFETELSQNVAPNKYQMLVVITISITIRNKLRIYSVAYCLLHYYIPLCFHRQEQMPLQKRQQMKQQQMLLKDAEARKKSSKCLEQLKVRVK